MVEAYKFRKYAIGHIDMHIIESKSKRYYVNTIYRKAINLIIPNHRSN